MNREEAGRTDALNSLIWWLSRPYALFLGLAFLLTPSCTLLNALESGAEFLNIDPSARAAAMGNAQSALALGAESAWSNPAVNRRPVIHAEVPSGDGMTVKVYTASGRLADEGRVSGAPGQVDDGAGPENAYEYEVREKLQAGVYYFTAEVTKGAQKISKSGKFAVLR